jgi:hypothetical protein
MSKSLLIIRPNYDIITSYFYNWSKKIILEAENKRITFYDLKEKRASRKIIESYIIARTPSFIFLNGHGNTESVLGQNGEVILSKTDTFSIKILYARSCEAAVILGATLVNHHVKTFIGYNKKFILGYTPAMISRPLLDNIAKLFLEPSNAIGMILLKGHTAQSAHNRSRKLMYRNFRRMISSNASYEEKYAARWLWSNFKNQVILGDSSQKM